MRHARVIAFLCALLSVQACAKLGDPRGKLAALGVPYSADAFVAQAGQGDDEAVKLLLASGMAVDARDASGATALTKAAAGGHLDVVGRLIDSHANVNLTSTEGPTPLTAAASAGHADVVQLLLSKGADPNAADGSKQTPLTLAVRARQAPVVKLLLDKGAHAWEQDDKWSALMLASFIGDREIVSLLLARDANVKAADDRGMTALMHAASTGQADIVKALIDKGADVNAHDAAGHTALMIAANNGEKAVAEALKNAGADVAAKNANGRTARDYAATNGHTDIVDLLESRATPAASAMQASLITESPAAPGDKGPLGLRDLDKLEHDRLTWPEDRDRFLSAARSAWAFLDARFNPRTGFVVGSYPYATIWDVGSMIAALYSAHELALVDDGRYENRMRTLLETLRRLPLHDDLVFNKAYDARTGEPAPPLGWSTTDMGRLLIWLRVVGADPHFREATESIVKRIDFTPMVKAGYLWGRSQEKDRIENYQEGTVGYEQYAAQGYALWGHRAEKALRWEENALPVSVMNQPVVADYRRWDRLTPEPFLLWGLEVGWDPATASLVRNMLRALEERHKKTGVVTITGEDAIEQPPYFFYYYCVYANGLDFTVDVQDRRAAVDGPRWISSKSAYAFDALMPTAYTAVAVKAVEAAHGSTAWASGVFEDTGKSTGNTSINTAAIILTAALYEKRGEPILAIP